MDSEVFARRNYLNISVRSKLKLLFCYSWEILWINTPYLRRILSFLISDWISYRLYKSISVREICVTLLL